MNWQLALSSSLGRFSHQDHRVVGVCIEGNVVHAAQVVRQKGRVVVEKLVSFRLPAGTLGEKAAGLKSRWRQEGLDGEEIVLAFPQAQAIVKTLTLPAIVPNEIEAMLRLQAARQTPLAIEEIAISWRRVDQTAAGYSRVIVAIVRKEDLRQMLSLFQEAGLPASQVVIDSWVSLPLVLGDAAPGISVAIEAREGTAHFGVFEGTVLRGTRSAPLPGPDERGGLDVWARALKQELEKTLLAYPVTDAQDKRAVVHLAGDDKRLIAGGRAIEQAGFQLKAFNPWQAGDCWPALAAGLNAFEPAAPGSDLLSGADFTRVRRPARKELIGVLAFSILFCGMLAGAIGLKFYARYAELDRLARFSALLSPQVKELRRMERRINLAKEKMHQEDSLVALLGELNRIVPGRISLHAMDFERGRPVVLQGTCSSLGETLRLVEALQKSALFSEVDLRSSEVQRLNDRDLVSFAIACRPAAEKRGRHGRQKA